MTPGNTLTASLADVPASNVARAAVQIDTTSNNLQTSPANASGSFQNAGGKALPEAIRDVMGMALIGGTGITIAVDDAADTITINASGTSTPPVSTHQRYGAYGADTTFVATDFTGAGGVGSTNNSLTLAGATARVYVAFWSAMALTTINPDGRLAFGGNNLFSRFTASRLTIGGDNGYLYVSSSTFPAGVVNGAWTLS